MSTARVGWIGTGIMGAPMCGHLMAAGYAATVYTRTRERAEPLLARGALWAATPREAAAASDVIFTMVGYPADVREVVLGRGGVLAGARPGAILVDMSTSEPALAREIWLAARERGVASLDAPVSGGDVGAREARLSIMVGGDADAFVEVKPLFERMGKTVVHQGPAGAGQHTKMVNQILIATGMIGVCEALVYARASGLDVATVLTSVSGGAAGSWSLSNYVPRIQKGDLEPGFMIEHFVKDMGIALAESRRLGLKLPGLELAESLYAELLAAGHGRKGIQALLLALDSHARTRPTT